MRYHLLILLVLGVLGAVWQMARPKHLEILIGESNLEVTADRAGLRQLAQLVERERLAGDLCLENLLHVDDPAPYRRKSSDDVRWVYDPTCPFAELEGPHKAYVALPNIDLEQELLDLAGHQHLLVEYRRALVRLDGLCSSLAALEPLPLRRSELLLQCRHYWTRAQDVHRHNLQNQRTPGYRCHGLTLAGPYLRLGQGALKPDGQPYHLALDDNGKGFFVIQTDTGLEYTRNGVFYRSYDGQLACFGLGRVLGTRGPIMVPETGPWIDDEGRLKAGGRLRVARPVDSQKLHEVQNGRFLGEVEETDDYRVKVGYLEQPNFDPRAEQYRLERVTRLLEAVDRVLPPNW